MEVLAALNLGDFAQIFSKMGMFPVFDLAYYIVSILYLKYEPGKWAIFSRNTKYMLHYLLKDYLEDILLVFVNTIDTITMWINTHLR